MPPTTSATVPVRQEPSEPALAALIHERVPLLSATPARVAHDQAALRAQAAAHAHLAVALQRRVDAVALRYQILAARIVAFSTRLETSLIRLQAPGVERGLWYPELHRLLAWQEGLLLAQETLLGQVQWVKEDLSGPSQGP